jgi:hypothetical protein
MRFPVRARRVTARVSMAMSFALLVLLVAVAPLRHRAPAGGWGICASAVVSIGAGLAYLRSTGDRPRIGRMSRTDRQAWQSARTLADLGELTAQWLEGRIASVPGYCGAPAEETVPLIPVLARLNRAGFVTDCSQPGQTGDGWEQRAAVQGYAAQDVALRIIGAVAADPELVTISCPPSMVPRWRYGYRDAMTVTRARGRHFTGFGVRIPRRHIRDGWIGHGMCSREAVKALCEAWQVTVIDPEWGRPDLLWQVLERAIRPGGGTS